MSTLTFTFDEGSMLVDTLYFFNEPELRSNKSLFAHFIRLWYTQYNPHIELFLSKKELAANRVAPGSDIHEGNCCGTSDTSTYPS